MKVSKVNYKSYTGYKAVGTKPSGYSIDRKPDNSLEGLNCLHALLDVVAAVECPFWGTVQNYDGVGMSAGLLHNIAVHRDGAQGSLGQLMRAMEVAEGDQVAHDARLMVWEFLAGKKIYVAQDGRFRNTKDGSLVSGPELRRALSGHTQGKASMNVELEQAKLAATLFGRMFEHFHETQFDYAAKWILNSNTRLETEALMYATGRMAQHASAQHLADAFWMLPLIQLPQEWAPALQAMILYHSHSVNAPGKAKNVLESVIQKHVSAYDKSKQSLTVIEAGFAFSKRLIRTLATTRYGAWHDTTDGANRYDRTRRALERHPYVDMSIMPKDFKV